MPAEAIAPPAAPVDPAAIPAGPATTSADNAINELFGVEPAKEDEPPKEPAAKEPVAPKEPKDKVEPAAPKAQPKELKDDKAQPKDPNKASSLREAKDRVEAENRTLRSKIQELETKLKTPPEDPEKKKLLEERENWGKTREELENELKFADYTRSQEYKDKYEAPFLEAYQSGRKRVEGLKIREPDQKDPATGDVIKAGSVRQGTAADFDNLMGIADDESAWDFANKTFGEKAPLVLNLREKVNELNTARVKAVDDFRAKGLERENQKTETTKAQQKEFNGMYQSAVKSALENPVLKDWFNADDGDDEGKAILEKGMKMADDAFLEEVTSKMTAQAKANLYSAIRNRAAAAGLLNHRLKQTKARVAELEAKLEEYEKSEPNLDGKGGRKEGGEAAPKGLAGFDAAVDRLAGGR